MNYIAKKTSTIPVHGAGPQKIRFTSQKQWQFNPNSKHFLGAFFSQLDLSTIANLPAPGAQGRTLRALARVLFVRNGGEVVVEK